MAATATTAFGLGVFVGNPNGNDPAANARFESDYDAFRTLLGATPKFMNAFTDFGQDPSQWASNASWTAWSWARTGAAYVGPTSGITPVIGVPLASNAGGWSNVDAFYRAIIAGTYDSAYRGIVTAWAGQGYGTIQLRLGYEFNGTFMPWSPGNSSSPTANADFVAAWQHVADLVHAQGRASGVVVQTVWNPADISWTNVPTAALYAGDAYVDLIGTDAYSPAYPGDLANWSTGGTTQMASRSEWAAIAANRAHFWQYTDGSQWNPTGNGAGWSMQDAIDLARAHNKPLTISETGAGNNGGTTGPVDDAAFPAWLAGALAQAQAQGVVIQNVDIWATDQSDGAWGFLNGEKPQEATSWSTYFGAGSANATTPVVVAPAPVVIKQTVAAPPVVGASTTVNQGQGGASTQVHVSASAPWAGASVAAPIATQVGAHVYSVVGVESDGNTGFVLRTADPVAGSDNQWGAAVTIVAQPQPAPPPTQAVVTDPLFDAAYYLAHNPDVAAAGVNPYQHYLTHGWHEGRNPDAWFDTSYYLAQNPDVAAAGVNPLLHFETNGWREGRQPSLVFDDAKYLATYPDVAAAGMDPLLHYIANGQAENRATFLTGGTRPADPLVDAAYYDRQLGATLIPTGTAAAQQAAWSYDTSGWQKGLNPNAWFDTNYYLSHNPDVAAAHIDPLLHYETNGWHEGRDPSAAFSTNRYLAAYTDVRNAGMDPLLHWVLNGQFEGRTVFAAPA